MTTSDREGKRERTFPLGRIVMTAHAVNTIPFTDIATGLIRHARCDWGDIGEDDGYQNECALGNGLRLHSVYHSRRAGEFWVITEGDRSATTVLLPDDY